MAQEPESLDLLSRALDQSENLIAGVRPSQADLPTPCRSWTVRQLVGHLVRNLVNFAAAARGEQPDYGTSIAEIGNDWPEAFTSARRGLDRAWSAADLQASVPSMGGGEAALVSRADQQVTEIAVHSWNLARATGQGEDLDVEVGEHGLAWATRNLGRQFRGSEEAGKAFAEEVPVPADAPVYERLAGWFGRDPRWASRGG
jgi:uncharacterized protein (TIGR03086 family)